MMSVYSDSPDVEAAILQLQDEHSKAQERWEADPTPENNETRLAAARAFQAARQSVASEKRGNTAAVGGDAFPTPEMN